jgi:hypothetical protein
MPEDKTLEGGASAGAETQENNSNESHDDDIDKDIEEIIKKEIPVDDDDDDDDDDTIVVPKKKMDKLTSNLKNYKDGLLSVKDKYLKKAGKGQQADNKQAPKKNVSDDDTPVTKADIRKGYEKEAIKEACKDEDVEKNWGEIVKFYSPRHGKDSAEDILADIEDAKVLWERKTTKKDDKEDDDKKSTAEIAAEKSKQAGTTIKSKDRETKHVLPTKSKIQDWYPKKDAK